MQASAGLRVLAILEGNGSVVRKIQSATLQGIQAVGVVIEIDSSLGLPGFSMVGLPDSAVREARERVVSAMRASGFQAMSRRITVNLAPADLRKEGSAFDLALAIGMLWATEQLDWKATEPILFAGELSLDGSVMPIRGALSMALFARSQGMALIVPQANMPEVAPVDGLMVCGVSNLLECVSLLMSGVPAATWGVGKDRVVVRSDSAPHSPDFSCVHGMAGVRRALEIAAAGWHHFLMIGSPGSGKTLCAQCVPSILAPLNTEEALEATMIHSCAGILPSGTGLLRNRPFRAPHHTATTAALMGGGNPIRPGEVSLAHNGLLFLDEFPEFSRSSLEGLRQPLEDANISIARAAQRVDWPARFLLGAAMNPCPCGYSLDPQRDCRCSPTDVARYRQRLSGPMLDRIDLQIQVPTQSVDVLQEAQGESSSAILARVLDAAERQWSRGSGAWNGRLSNGEVRKYCKLESDQEAFLKKASEKLQLSTRGVYRVLKVARTIADLAKTEKIMGKHLAEALQYRLP